MESLGDLPGGSFGSAAGGVSADGTVVVGVGQSEAGTEGFRWSEATGMVAIGDLPGGSFASGAHRISDDGLVIVGASVSASGGREAFRLTAGSGMVGLGDLPGGSFDSISLDTSADGSVIVGTGNSAVDQEAFRWTAGDGMVGLGDLSGGIFRSITGSVSADGSVVVGFSISASGGEAFRWTAGEGMVGLGDLPGGFFNSGASDVSADGSLIVGSSSSTLNDHEAFIWDPINGMRSLKAVLEGDYGLDLTGWWLRGATAITPDGNTIVGHGTNPSGGVEAWIAELSSVPEPGGASLGVVALAAVAVFRALAGRAEAVAGQPPLDAPLRGRRRPRIGSAPPLPSKKSRASLLSRYWATKFSRVPFTSSV